MKIKNLLLTFIVSFFFIIPINIFAYSNYVYVSGETIGIEVNSSGVLIVGFYKIDDKYIAKDAGFEVGDIITSINDTNVSTIDEMISVIDKSSSSTIVVNVLRNEQFKIIKLELKYDGDNILKTGLYVKDKITGIGTLTYVDPDTKKFGALGHEILESTTASKFEIKDGKIFDANVTNITKSRSGKAGEKNANYDRSAVSGEVTKNEITGIFGTYNKDISDKELLEVGKVEDIQVGEAVIRTVINASSVQEFKIKILSLNINSDTKNILFEVTDPRLLEETGGIVQGMSGSPIIQNNKVIGAVNYVIVNDTTKGYGVFITNMLEIGDQ